MVLGHKLAAGPWVATIPAEKGGYQEEGGKEKPTGLVALSVNSAALLGTALYFSTVHKNKWSWQVSGKRLTASSKLCPS